MILFEVPNLKTWGQAFKLACLPTAQKLLKVHFKASIILKLDPFEIR